MFDVYLELINGFVLKGFPVYMEQLKKLEIQCYYIGNK